jgi:hypothetical protein
MLMASGLNILKGLKKSKKSVRLITNHPDGDNYDGIILGVSENLVILQEENGFAFGGVVALPLNRIKGRRLGSLEHLRDQVVAENGQFKKLIRYSWLRAVKNIEQILKECARRKIWPIVETIRKRKTALFIGPITQVGPKEFSIFCYDANGKWEKEYLLNYREIFKVEIFDSYSTHFNRFMSKRVPKRFKQYIK